MRWPIGQRDTGLESSLDRHVEASAVDQPGGVDLATIGLDGINQERNLAGQAERQAAAYVLPMAAIENVG